MKKYFVDTNVFLRVILKDNKKQSPLCRKLFLKAEHGEIQLVTHSIVICEIVWVLISIYKFSKQEINGYLNIVLNSKGLEIVDGDLLRLTADLFSYKNVDFIDLFIASWMRKAGMEKIFSFDKDYDKVEGVRRLEP